MKAKFQHWQINAGGTAIVSGLAAIAYFAQVSPVHNRYEQAQAQTELLTTEQSKAVQLERSVNEMQEHLDSAKEAAEKSQLKLEPASELNTRLAKLTQLAGENHLQLDVTESGATTNSDRYSSVAIRLSGRGSYRNCVQMLKQLRLTMPDVGVVSVELASASVKDDSNATFGFELLWYRQPQPRPAKK